MASYSPPVHLLPLVTISLCWGNWIDAGDGNSPSLRQNFLSWRTILPIHFFEFSHFYFNHASVYTSQQEIVQPCWQEGSSWALEGQSSTEGHQGPAGHVQGHTEEDFGLCQGQPSEPHGQQRQPEEPGDHHAQEAPGGDPEGWVDYPLLKQCM